ncbi:MAG TPA: glycosyltransferase [Pyrinomonadaceae bacterium]|jgi:GT2 family glycosyltransferase
MIVAREADLALPEFAAFNHGRDYPRMRRWELPFALQRMRLPNTAAVLDCTINPVDFAARLQGLYPHALYRHWSPVQRGGFAPPLGVPDESFDRVVCVNTLEHLLAEQRDALVAEMACKLKPGGLLVVTSDFYFDSMWRDEALARSGVIRADGGEVFNGWNRVAVREHVELCRRHGLHPLDDDDEAEPREGDVGLFLNTPPHAHACVAGVFRKGEARAPFADSRRVALALLTWNTRDISLDSARALAAEAAMLRRLGHEASVVFCDNGSVDGTPAALEALASEFDAPCKLILNGENRGSSVARNQIIDYAVGEWRADYLLFTDGDIEIVPHSSFAMLRHMENQGRRLGCVGALSSGHTPDRARVTPYLFGVEAARVQPNDDVAWTQYGLFRREVFDDGVRFDESAPFDRPGWGFEDNDLAFQMGLKGYATQRFYGMTYLHRSVHSSLRIMGQRGIDAADAYARRRQYVLDKWAGVPSVNDGPLTVIRQVRMPYIPQP